VKNIAVKNRDFNQISDGSIQKVTLFLQNEFRLNDLIWDRTQLFIKSKSQEGTLQVEARYFGFQDELAKSTNKLDCWVEEISADQEQAKNIFKLFKLFSSVEEGSIVVDSSGFTVINSDQVQPLYLLLLNQDFIRIYSNQFLALATSSSLMLRNSSQRLALALLIIGTEFNPLEYPEGFEFKFSVQNNSIGGFMGPLTSEEISKIQQLPELEHFLSHKFYNRQKFITVIHQVFQSKFKQGEEYFIVFDYNKLVVSLKEVSSGVSWSLSMEGYLSHFIERVLLPRNFFESDVNENYYSPYTISLFDTGEEVGKKDAWIMWTDMMPEDFEEEIKRHAVEWNLLKSGGQFNLRFNFRTHILESPLKPPPANKNVLHLSARKYVPPSDVTLSQDQEDFFRDLAEGYFYRFVKFSHELSHLVFNVYFDKPMHVFSAP
jgi:hypothetical protein